MKSAEPKSAKFEAFYDLVLKVLAERGQDYLSASLISRSLGFSRAWIYKYFGSSKEKWIETAAQEVGRFIAELEQNAHAPDTLEETLQDWRRGSLRMLDDFEKKPWLGLLYFRYVGQQGHPVGRAIRKVEDEYRQLTLKRLKKISQFSSEACEAIAFAVSTKKMSLAHLWARGIPQKAGIKREDWVEQMIPNLARF